MNEDIIITVLIKQNLLNDLVLILDFEQNY